MARFFVETLPAAGEIFRLDGENDRHAKVLRLRPGEEITLCDGQGLECSAALTETGDYLAGETRACPAEAAVGVTLYLAFPKADKLEHVIQKAAELGAAELVAFPSRYCVSRPDEKSLPKKLERWQKIARSAAEQSRRGRIPTVRVLPSYAAALAEAARADLPIFCYENERSRTLRAAVEAAPFRTASVMTGAEGGFSEEEAAQAEAAGLKICTLGRRILRCETAPLAALAALMYAVGEF